MKRLITKLIYDRMIWNKEMPNVGRGWKEMNGGWVMVKNGRKSNFLRFEGYDVGWQLVRFKSHEMNGWKWEEMEDGKRWCNESEEMEYGEMRLFDIWKPRKATNDVVQFDSDQNCLRFEGHIIQWVEWRGECMKCNASVDIVKRQSPWYWSARSLSWCWCWCCCPCFDN